MSVVKHVDLWVQWKPKLPQPESISVSLTCERSRASCMHIGYTESTAVFSCFKKKWSLKERGHWVETQERRDGEAYSQILLKGI